MFSTAGTITTRLIGSCMPTAATKVPITVAAPHMSYFISSMPPCGLEVDAAGVEGDALADQHVGLGVAAVAVLQHDQLGRIGRAARHREQRAHAQRLPSASRSSTSHSALSKRAANSCACCGEVGRVADVRRQVAELARERDAGGDRLALRQRVRRRRRRSRTPSGRSRRASCSWRRAWRCSGSRRGRRRSTAWRMFQAASRPLTGTSDSVNSALRDRAGPAARARHRRPP